MGQNRTDALVSCILAALYGKVNSILAVGNDVAVLTPYKISPDEEERLSDAVAACNQKYNTSFSVIDIDSESFVKWKDSTSFYREIDRSGTILWPDGSEP